MRQTLGVLLVIIGVAYFAFHGFSYTSQDKVLGVGPFSATTTQHNEVLPYSPLLGGAIIIGGIALFIAGLRRPVV